MRVPVHLVQRRAASADKAVAFLASILKITNRSAHITNVQNVVRIRAVEKGATTLVKNSSLVAILVLVSAERFVRSYAEFVTKVPPSSTKVRGKLCSWSWLTVVMCLT